MSLSPFWTRRRRGHISADDARALREENTLLRRAVAEKLSNMELVNMVFDRGMVDFTFQGGMGLVIAEAFAQQLVREGAENYLEMHLTSKKYLPGERLVITIQRTAGKTPHELRAEAEQALAQAIENNAGAA